MNNINLRNFMMMILGITIVFSINAIMKNSTHEHQLQSSYLINPISDKMILITSAGQATDSYILQDLANELRLNNLFMPETSSLEIENLSAVVISVGYSELGLSLHDRSFNDEYSRIRDLIAKARENDLPIVTVFVGQGV